RTRRDVIAPTLGHQGAERLANAERAAVSSRSAEQTQSEDRAAMRVHTRGRSQHCALCRNADGAQPVHARALSACDREIAEERCQRVGASAQQLGVHVAVRAIVEMADEPRFWIGLDFQLEAK